MKVNREKLLHCLDSVRPGLSPREILEQSKSFVFQGGFVRTFNDETACKAPSPLGKKISGAVPADKLLEVLGRLPDDELDVEVKDGELIVAGKRRKAGLRMDAEILLPLDAVEEPDEKGWSPLPADFAEAVATVGRCAGTDETELARVCVHIHPKWLEASDNYQVCRWRLKTGLEEPVLVRQAAVKDVAKLGVTELARTESWLHFRNPEGFILSVRRYAGDYPDFAKILHVDGTKVALPKGLGEAAKNAGLFSKENTDGDSVLIDLKPGKLRVKGQGISGWYEERSKIAYDGPSLSFLAPPELLADVVSRHNEVIVSETRLKAELGKCVFVSCLTARDKPNGTVTDAEEDGGE